MWCTDDKRIGEILVALQQMNGQSVENGKQKHCITWRLNSRNKGDYMWNKQQILVIKVILPTNKIMSDIKQPLESVIVILQIATKVGVCEVAWNRLRTKWGLNSRATFGDRWRKQYSEKNAIQESILSFILIIATIKLTSISTFVNSRPL